MQNKEAEEAVSDKNPEELPAKETAAEPSGYDKQMVVDNPDDI